MTTQANTNNSGLKAAGAPVWWLVCKWELRDLWIGGRVLVLLILFSVMMSITLLIQHSESQLSKIPPAEIVFIILQSTITFGLFLGLIVGGDSVSGERERATLETLLITPTSRQQIVLGKFLAALSPWPVAMLLSIPYMTVVAEGEPVVGRTLLIGGVMGTLLAIAFTGFGMLVSIWAKSNRISLFINLLVYVLLLIPTLWPGAAQKGDLGYFIQRLNPMQGTSEFLEKVLVNNRTISERAPYAMAAIYSAIVVVILLFFYAAPGLHLDGGAPRLPFLQRLRRRGRGQSVASLLLIGALALALSGVRSASAAEAANSPLQIAVDLDYQIMKAGDEITFNTVVTNNGAEASPDFHVSMNIIKIGSGDPVDPEDWSPERTQAVEALAPGATAEQEWTVHGILEGNYMVYLTIIPTPDGPEATSQTVSSMGIHLTISASEKTNPGGVLPVAIGIPLVLTVGTAFMRVRQRQGGGKAAAQGDSVS